MKTNAPQHLLGSGIAALQLLDIAVHAATGQLEAIRVASNLVVLLGLAVLFSRRFRAYLPRAGAVSVGLYLLLNLVFLTQAGLTNPEQGGGWRIALILFVSLTVVLSVLLWYRIRNRQLA